MILSALKHCSILVGNTYSISLSGEKSLHVDLYEKKEIQCCMQVVGL
jgi:hypothetical protein